MVIVNFLLKRKGAIKKVFPITLLLTSHASVLFATTLSCVLPDTRLKNQNQNDYIKLVEPRTVIYFDEAKNVSRFSSPGCHKFQSISQWTNSFAIKCEGSNGDLIDLKINTANLKFNKIYLNNRKSSQSLPGFCKISQN
ncbi:MAG: hypothetical protein CML40_05175 [Rhodobacteraceae bacterium]|nr:MAG: hypothetical protein CML40_05175 [Paracoccaceae bacterium]